MASTFLACFLLLLINTSGTSGLACHAADTIVLEGQLSQSGDLRAGGYVFTPNLFQAVNKTHFQVCICSVEKCIKKCCNLGMAFDANAQCASTNSALEFNVYNPKLVQQTSNPSTVFRLITGGMCESKYNLDPESNKNDQYYLINTGALYLPNMPDGPENYTRDIFCVENLIVDDIVQPIVLVCFVDEKKETVITAYPVGVIISIPFLVITLLVYALLPDLRNLNGKNLMCQVASMIVAYSILAVLQLTTDEIDHTTCVVAAYMMQYSFLATFFWLNVTSYDLWWTFGGFGGILLTRHRDSLKFAFYSLYAWGGPLILIAITLGLDLTPNLPSYIVKPKMGEARCWFEDDTALFSYFYGPIAAILVINFIFFALTAYKIFAVHKEANNVLAGDNSRRSSEATKQKFFLYLKLFFVMGVNWIMEVVSAAHDDKVYKYLFIVTDICNALQGILIFIIFVCNARTKKRLMKRFGMKTDRDTTTMATSCSSRQSSMVMSARHNTGLTGNTRTSEMSTTEVF